MNNKNNIDFENLYSNLKEENKDFIKITYHLITKGMLALPIPGTMTTYIGINKLLGKMGIDTLPSGFKPNLKEEQTNRIKSNNIK